jgi:hypothetical protein
MDRAGADCRAALPPDRTQAVRYADAMPDTLNAWVHPGSGCVIRVRQVDLGWLGGSAAQPSQIDLFSLERSNTRPDAHMV